METVSKSARQELVVAVRKRYENASKFEKGQILAEFTAVTGFHRKHAIRLLNQDSNKKAVDKRVPLLPGRRIYDEAVKSALIVLWEASDRICGKRLKAVIPTLLAALERHGHIRLEPEVRKSLLSISAATIDRMMSPGTQICRVQAKTAQLKEDQQRDSGENVLRLGGSIPRLSGD